MHKTKYQLFHHHDALPILWKQGKCWMCVCVWFAIVWVVLGGVGVWLRRGSGRVVPCYVCVCCESGLFAYMAGPCICI